MAQKTNDLSAQAQAAASLGLLAHKVGRFSDAAEHFAVSFQAAKELGDLKMLGVARVNLGLARGAAAAHLVEGAVGRDDLKALLDWKISRVPLGYLQPPGAEVASSAGEPGAGTVAAGGVSTRS